MTIFPQDYALGGYPIVSASYTESTTFGPVAWSVPTLEFPASQGTAVANSEVPKSLTAPPRKIHSLFPTNFRIPR